MGNDSTIIDFGKETTITEGHLLAIMKLCPGAEWTFNGKELIWHKSEFEIPSIEDIEKTIPDAIKERDNEIRKEELIQEKIRELAIQELKNDGILDKDGNLIENEEDDPFIKE